MEELVMLIFIEITIIVDNFIYTSHFIHKFLVFRFTSIMIHEVVIPNFVAQKNRVNSTTKTRNESLKMTE